VDLAGLSQHVSLGDRLTLIGRDGRRIDGAIVAFRHDTAVVMKFEPPPHCARRSRELER
jgi:hypothetical protein